MTFFPFQNAETFLSYTLTLSLSLTHTLHCEINEIFDLKQKGKKSHTTKMEKKRQNFPHGRIFHSSHFFLTFFSLLALTTTSSSSNLSNQIHFSFLFTTFFLALFFSLNVLRFITDLFCAHSFNLSEKNHS